MIDSVGAQGDGVARDGERTLYVSFTNAGDRVRARLVEKRGDGILAELVEVLEPGPGRTVPLCPLFGTCGGCALQHLDAETYAAWKTERLASALGRRGLGDVVVEPPVLVGPGTRRRASLAAVATAGGVVLGFSARHSHRVVDVDRCPLLLPALDRLLGPLRAVLATVLAPGERGQVQVSAASEGVDLLLALPSEPGLAGREALAAFADAHDVGRLSWKPVDGGAAEPVIERRPLTVDVAGVAVPFPPGAFLQPSLEGERALAGLVAEGLGDVSRVVDLFAGLGTFSFALAGKARVHAVEGEAEAASRLELAAGRAGLGGRVSAEVRDLERRPLLPDELARFDAALFDPPRAGAAAQAETLAASALPRVVGVSCNPNTFARDARLLVDGGFELVRVVPVDQFTWAAHVEVVGVFAR